jgi:hypothetical protein
VYIDQCVSNHLQSPSGPTTFPAEASDLWHPLVTGAGDWATRCCSTVLAVNKQWLDFLQKRFKADWEMPERVMSCSSPYEAWSVHVGFLQKAFTDYQKELTALANLGVVKIPARGE